MAEQTKIFISWSGEHSKSIALLLREWLRELFDNVQPFVSDRDIEPGARSMAVIERELADTTFGIVLTSKDNQDAPWINFEAGALSKEVGDSANRVIPLLLDMASPTELTGPLSQFQAQRFDEAGMRSVVGAIATAIGASTDVVAKRFDRSWSEFEGAVAAIPQPQAPVSPPRSLDDKMDESLAILRSIRESVPRPYSTTSSWNLDHPDSFVALALRDFMRQHNIAGAIKTDFVDDTFVVTTRGLRRSDQARISDFMNSRFPKQSWRVEEAPNMF